MFRVKSKAGRTLTGRRVCFTKGGFGLRIRRPVINYTGRYKSLSTNLSFKIVPFYTKLTSLVYFGSGG